MPKQKQSKRRGQTRQTGLVAPPAFTVVPVMQRRMRFVCVASGGGMHDVTGANLLSLMSAVSNGSGTSTAAVSIMSAVRVRRIAVYAGTPSVPTSGVASPGNRVVLTIPAGEYAPAQVFTCDGYADGSRPIIYSPKKDESLGFWINWRSDINTILNVALFQVGTLGPAGSFTVDLDIDFTLDLAGDSALAYFTYAGANSSGVYFNALDLFAVGGGPAAATVTPDPVFLTGGATTGSWALV